MTATGYAALYIDLVAGVDYYKWLSPAIGVSLASFVVLMGIVHALYLNSKAFTLLIVAGSAVMLPLLIGTPQVVFFYLALSLLTLVFYYKKDELILTLVRTIPLLIAFPLWRGEESYSKSVAIFFAAWFIFTVSQYLLTLWQDKLQEPSHRTLPLLSFTTLLGAVLVLAADEKKLLAIISFAIAVVFALLARTSRDTIRVVFTLLALSNVLVVVAAFTDARTTSVFSLVALIASVYLAKKLPSAVGTIIALLGSVVALGSIALSGVVTITTKPELYYLPTRVPKMPYRMEWQTPVLWALSLALVFTLMWAADLFKKVFPKDFVLVLLAATGLYLWMGFLVTTSFFVAYTGTSFIVAHMMATLSFIVAVVLLLAFSDKLPSVWRKFALCLLFVAVGKLFLFDLQALDGLVRVVAFTLTGIILLGLNTAGLLGKKKESQPHSSVIEEQRTSDITGENSSR